MQEKAEKISFLFSLPMCIFFCLFFFPIGLILVFMRLYKKGKIGKKAKNIAVTVNAILIAFLVVGLFSPSDGTDSGQDSEPSEQNDSSVAAGEDLGEDFGEDQGTEANYSLVLGKNARQDFSSISVGMASSFAIDEAGTLWAWGLNDNGQLGVGSKEDSAVPVQVLENVVAVDTSGFVTLALKGDGTLWAWGTNGRGQLGSSEFFNDYSGPSIEIQTSPLLVMDQVVAISAGTNIACILKSSGDLWQFGVPAYQNTGSTCQKILSNVVSVSVGADDSILAVKSDHTLWAKGDSSDLYYRPKNEEDKDGDFYLLETDVSAATSGLHFWFYIKTDGSLWGWGQSEYGTLLTNSDLDNGLTYVEQPKQLLSEKIVAVSTSYLSVLAIGEDGTLYGWGSNSSGQLGNNGAGDVIGNLGAYITKPIIIDTNVVAASTGQSHSIYLKSNGQLYACGYNSRGELGNDKQANCHDEKNDLIIWQTIPIPVMNHVMLPTDNSVLYDCKSQYPLEDGVYYGTGRDFKNYKLTVSKGLLGSATCEIVDEETNIDPYSYFSQGPIKYVFTFESGDSNYAVDSEHLIILNIFDGGFEIVPSDETFEIRPYYCSYYEESGNREANDSLQINLDDLVGTWMLPFRKAIFVIYKQDNSYYLNFAYGSVYSRGYLNGGAPMLLIGNDVVIQYTEDSLGYSGKITIQKGTYGDFFITSTVDNASLSEDDFAGSDLPAMVTDREELIKDDSLVETSIYIEYLDPDLYAE